MDEWSARRCAGALRHSVHSNSKMSLNEGRGKGRGNGVIIDLREGGLQVVSHRLGRPSLGASSCLRKTLGGGRGAKPTFG